MAKLSLLIADESDLFRSGLVEHLQDSFHIHCCQNGAEAADYVQSHQPDMIVLDLMLSKVDGISLLHAVAAAGQHPRILATTRLDTPFIVETAQRLGVEYLMKKPCRPKDAADRVMDLSQALHPHEVVPVNPELIADELLLSLDCLPKLRGYPQLQAAILLVVQNEDAAITKIIYPTIAARFKTTPVQVERAIRGVITSAWEHRESELWQVYFPAEKHGAEHRPSNGAFISRMAAEVRRRLGIRKELT